MDTLLERLPLVLATVSDGREVIVDDVRGFTVEQITSAREIVLAFLDEAAGADIRVAADRWLGILDRAEIQLNDKRACVESTRRELLATIETRAAQHTRCVEILADAKTGTTALPARTIANCEALLAWCSRIEKMFETSPPPIVGG